MEPAGHAPLQADWAKGTGQAIGAHTGASEQCSDAIEARIGADWPARIHRVRETAPWVGEMRGRGCLRNAWLDGQNG